MNDFQQYQRTQIAELRPYVKGESLVGISISEVDIGCGSPRVGDMIARNPANHADQWLVAKAYFEQNFAPLEDSVTIETLRRQVAELEEKIEHYDTAEYHLSQMVKSLTAENTKLKRQVEALREDAEVGRDAIEAMAIMDTLRRIAEGWSVEILNDNPDPETKDVQCGVVVHSDFGMTQDQYLGETVLGALRKALKSTVEALREATKTGE